MSHPHYDPVQPAATSAEPVGAQDGHPARRTVLTDAAALAAVGFVPSAAEARPRKHGNSRHA